MRKRKLLQNFGTGFLAVVLIVSSVSASMPEGMSEHDMPDTGIETEMEEITEAAENMSELRKTETQDVTEIHTEYISEKETDYVKKPLPEEETEENSEAFSEKYSEEKTEDQTEQEEDTESQESESESETEKESCSETEMEEKTGVLTAKSEIMDMTILAPDDSGFPAGSQLVLYAGEELRKMYGQADWDYETFLDDRKEEWTEKIQEKYGADTMQIEYLYPYYFKVMGKDGERLTLPEDVQVCVNFYDREAMENVQTRQNHSVFGLHTSNHIQIIEDLEVYGDTEKECLAASNVARECGLYSIVQLKEKEAEKCTCDSKEKEGLVHAWDCPIFRKALEEVCDCGSEADTVTGHEVSCNGVWEAFHAACSGCVAEKERKGMLHDDCEVVLRIHRELCECDSEENNLEKAIELHEEDSRFVQYILELASYLNSQTEMTVADKGQLATENISAVSGWTNGNKAASDHLTAKFYAGKSSLEMIGGSTVSGKWIQGSMSQKNCLYWLPLQDNLSDKTSHGALYHNVIYDYKTGKWYDMKFTIQAYQKTVLSGSNKTVYPFAGFYKNRLQFGFDRQGPMVIRCQILEAGTSTEARVKVKIPVWDIDDAQYVGIKQNNGTMDHRYYYSGADEWLRAKNSVSIAGVGGLYYVEGKFGTAAKNLSTAQACAVWEMTTSDFSFAFGYYNNDTTAESTRWDRFHIFSTNTTIGDGSYGANGTYGVVAIYSQDNVAPDLQKPEKRVSADNKTWAKNLELSGITGSYYYAIDYTVLDTIPDYHFSSLILSDTLPEGTDYVSGLRVTRIEDGANKTGWFTTSTADDKIRLTATAGALAADDFYGYTYRVTFKVKMDPTETEPVYQSASGKDVYTVSNKGTVSVKRGSTSSDSTTNTVTTTASRERPRITVYKKGSRNEMLSGAQYQIVAKENIVSLAGKTIYTAGSIVGTVTTGKDGKAVSERLYPGSYTVKEVKAPLGYALNQTGKNVTVSYLNPDNGAGDAEAVFVNNRLYSTIQVTKEIDTADIVWAHGNPVFTFKVAGKDTMGNSHVYYDTVEFTKGNAGSGEKARLTAVFKVYAGTYTVSEEKTARYRLASVHSVVNGSVSGQNAVLHVEGTQTDTAGPAGSVVFYNQKTTDGGQSHTAFARNSIKK